MIVLYVTTTASILGHFIKQVDGPPKTVPHALHLHLFLRRAFQPVVESLSCSSIHSFSKYLVSTHHLLSKEHMTVQVLMKSRTQLFLFSTKTASKDQARPDTL